MDVSEDPNDKNKINVTLDATDYVKAYMAGAKHGLELSFLMLAEFNDLETVLNERGIDGEKED